MHPIDDYSTIQRGLEEIRQRAERERLIRAAKLRKPTNWSFLRSYVKWLRARLAKWRRKPGRFGTYPKTLPSPSASPHH